VHQSIEIADDSKTLVIHEKAEVPDLLSTHYHYGYMRRLKNRPELAREISGIIESAENFGSEEQILKLVVIEAQNSYQLTFWFSESWKIIGCMIGQRRDVF
jgi:hypothetical protein